GLLLFPDPLEVAVVLLSPLLGRGAAPGRGPPALSRTGPPPNEPAQRGDRQPGLDPDQVVVADLAGSKEIADLLKRVRTPHTSATHHAERLPCRGGSSTQGDPTHTRLRLLWHGLLLPGRLVDDDVDVRLAAFGGAAGGLGA